MMQYFLLGFSLLGLVFTYFWIKKPDSKKDLGYAIFSLIGCLAMLAMSIYLLFE